MIVTIFSGLITMQSLGRSNYERQLQVQNMVFVTNFFYQQAPRSGNLPVLFLLSSQ